MVIVAAVCVVSAQEAASTNTPAAVVKEEGPSTGFSFATTLDLYSAYVWRGAVINDRPVVQPGATVSYATGDYGTFSANVWANFDLTDRKGHTAFGGINEIDYTASYAIDVGPVSLSVGHIWYTFPKVSGPDYLEGTREVYFTAQYNNDIVNPFVKVYYDYDAVDSAYANFGVNKTVKVSDRLSVGSEVSVGVAEDDYRSFLYGGVSEGGLCDFNASLFASYAITDHISVGPRVAWLSLLDSSRDGTFVDNQEVLWGGVNMSATF
jgi:hypothetical protein